MTRREPLIRIHHMLDHAREAVALLGDRSRSELACDRTLNLALVRLMEIVGEAAARIPEDFRSLHAQVPWQDVADLRNRLIHGYDAVDLDILWTIITDDLGPLIEQLDDMIDHSDP